MLQPQKAKHSASARKASSPPIPAHSKLPPLTVDNRKETEEILNSILPPREWEEEGQLWRQQVHTKHTCMCACIYISLYTSNHFPLFGIKKGRTRF
jgi:hypothetical protein